MLDNDLRTLRDDIDAQVPIPAFESLVSRGRQRRRRTGAGIAVLALLAGGVVIGAENVVQQDAGPPPATTPPVPNRTADELIESKGATLRWYEQPEPGFQYAVWGNECDEVSCALALTWSTDNWETRESNLMPTWGDVWWTGENFLVFQEENIAYLLNPDGSRTAVSAPAKPRPARPNELVVGHERMGEVLLDPQTGQTHRILVPQDIAVRQLDNGADGTVQLLGEISDGSGVLATSTDGGVTWNRNAIPMTPAGASFITRGAKVAIVQQGLEGTELTVSTDDGNTWDRVEDLPFSGSDCLTTAGTLLFVSNGTQLFRSTDESWMKFERVTNAPPMECPSSTDSILSATGADKQSGWVSEDLGETWTVLEPR